MTSKEALEKLRRLAVDSESDLTNFAIAREYTAIIEKDLKVLEIFKKHLTIEVEDKPSFNNLYIVRFKEDDEECDYTFIFVSKEEKELLMEYLKNN